MRGFTLIETLIYIALLGLIMTGALLTAYDLIGSATQVTGNATVVDEGSFVGRKIAWSLTGSTTPTVAGSGCSMTLSVIKAGHGSNPIEFRRNATDKTIEMRQGGTGVFTPITTANVAAECLKFGIYAGIPQGVTATTTINGHEFAITRYSRI
jgi:prepilin-type N-terminal cleavage/methylation domain-containing protein